MRGVDAGVDDPDLDAARRREPRQPERGPGRARAQPRQRAAGELRIVGRRVERAHDAVGLGPLDAAAAGQPRGDDGGIAVDADHAQPEPRDAPDGLALGVPARAAGRLDDDGAGGARDRRRDDEAGERDGGRARRKGERADSVHAGEDPAASERSGRARANRNAAPAGSSQTPGAP